MKSERGRNLVSYQRVLRTVGAYLDEFAASHVSVIETRDGIALRTDRPGNGTVSSVLEFQYDDLIDRNSLLTRRRGRGAMAAAKPQRLYSGHHTLDAMYQDLFRALGWELDLSSAYNILVEELNGSLLVSYIALRSPTDPVWMKRSATLGVPELETMLKDAYGRRQPPPLLRRRIVPTS